MNIQSEGRGHLQFLLLFEKFCDLAVVDQLKEVADWCDEPLSQIMSYPIHPQVLKPLVVTSSLGGYVDAFLVFKALVVLDLSAIMREVLGEWVLIGLQEEGRDLQFGDGVYAGVFLLPLEQLGILEIVDQLIQLEQGGDLLLLQFWVQGFAFLYALGQDVSIQQLPYPGLLQPDL